MKANNAILKFSALANERRLEVFRLLVKAGPSGLAAGRISDETGIAPNTLSAQLHLLSQAGLVTSERKGRSIIYAARFDAVSDLIVYLMEDCCGGEPCVADDVQAALARMECCAPEGRQAISAPAHGTGETG
ncbi:helix-turn-helix transcriptional regulator [Henriciella sp.]|uniref:ArsR/SmtB family transcription factor n=1 Tax=Henriciella sp. TaxID=1968823 RepID=UPI002609CF7B|nr:metalloregulator ArsR/SmtB family transcription factor [Henriciella sp.]